MKTILSLMTGLILVACAQNPVKVANDTEQKAYALYGSFVIFETEGAQLVADPSIPVNAKLAIKSADAKAKPTADALLQSVLDYDTAVTQLKAAPAGGSADAAQKVSNATLHLNAWVEQATADINSLITAVKSR